MFASVVLWLFNFPEFNFGKDDKLGLAQQGTRSTAERQKIAICFHLLSRADSHRSLIIWRKKKEEE